ncbi:MAG: hypothetical protein JOZ99_01035 [Actinobacteria bacterium]|nr:hypothetical protein [Actinomycetota bacterium]
MEQVETAYVVRGLVDRLPALQRAIVRAYYLEGRNQADISRELGRSQMFVSRNLARSRTTLRAMITEGESTRDDHDIDLTQSCCEPVAVNS